VSAPARVGSPRGIFAPVATNQASGEVLAAVSNAIVQILSECYGRGPTKAKSYMFDDYVFTVVEDLFTTVEQTLVARGRTDLVRDMRVSFQEEIADRFKEAVSAAVGRRVLAYHSQVIFDPPLGFEVFVLEPD
jgi:uncharacterized protein YbcI